MKTKILFIYMNSHAYSLQVDRSDGRMIALGDKSDYRKITRNIAIRYKISAPIFVSVFTLANVMSLTHAIVVTHLCARVPSYAWYRASTIYCDTAWHLCRLEMIGMHALCVCWPLISKGGGTWHEIYAMLSFNHMYLIRMQYIVCIVRQLLPFRYK